MRDPRPLSLLILLAPLLGACVAGRPKATNPDGGGSTGGDMATNNLGPCSDTLQGVDPNGTYQCPPDQGCLNGVCVPACDAAAQAKGTTACDFWAPDPAFFDNGDGTAIDGSCYAAFLANTWGRAALITVTRGTQTFDVTKFGRIPKGVGAQTTYAPLPASGLPPNEVAVLFLSHKPGVIHPLGSSMECPVEPALLKDASIEGEGRGTAFHITVDTPVNAYDIMPYGGAKSFLPSASLLLPSTAWGTNYFGIGPHADGGGRLWVLAVGSVAGTTLRIAPKAALTGGAGLADAPVGKTTTFTLGAGEMLQWYGDGTGAIFESDQPIGVFTGNTYLRVATATSPGGGGQDAAHQQIQHIKALGSEYVGPGVVTRLASLAPESVLYRIQGVVAGTQLTWEPAATSNLAKLAAGDVVEFESTANFTVKSQDGDHPFQLTQYLGGTPGTSSRPGCGSSTMFGGGCALGDEEWVVLLPPQQFARSYVFFTDPSYATTNLVLTRVQGMTGFSDVTLDCLGIVKGWKPVGTSGQYEVAYVDLVRGETPVGTCGTSRHEATSDGTFGVMVWGTDWYASYAYPAGGYFSNINQIDVPPPQ